MKYKCECKGIFNSAMSRGSHRRFCKAYQVIFKKLKRKDEKKKKIICSVCKKKYHTKTGLSHHLSREKDRKHKDYILKLERKACEWLKKGLSEYDVDFILGTKNLWIFWRKNFTEQEIKKIRHKFKYKRKYFICEKCKHKFKQRQAILKLCKKCLRKRKIEKVLKAKHYKKICKVCKKKFIGYKHTKYCSPRCSGVIAGRNSAKKRVKRSKNEKYFARLCKKQFKLVWTNKNIFNGWDADVILPKEKIAILWNGPWHYRKITYKHSLKQVQNRDKIKAKEIKKKGYNIYIIKDDGKYNKNFVKKQFERFLRFFEILR